MAVRARDLVHRMERRWSRFLDTSEVSALNRVAGKVTVVSESTFHLVSCAVTANEVTGGRFNPLMLDQLENQGYDRPWSEGVHVPNGGPVIPATDEVITLYPDGNAVRLPAGCRFDPGGIGKGMAVDMAMELCIANDATTACIELGGDLRVHGVPWYGPLWEIGVADPFDPDGKIASFTPTDGAVTTSTTLRRNWEVGGERFHHLLDPLTGRPSKSDLVAVTTCSSLAWWAEVACKTALIAGSKAAFEVLDDLNTPGIAVTGDGQILRGSVPHPAGV